MRGKVLLRCVQVGISRITPAYAGKSQLFTSPSISTVGSPPPMRGKATKAGYSLPLSWITPAYAGKSSVIA